MQLQFNFTAHFLFGQLIDFSIITGQSPFTVLYNLSFKSKTTASFFLIWLEDFSELACLNCGFCGMSYLNMKNDDRIFYFD